MLPADASPPAVLAPPELLEQLNALASRGGPRAGGILLAARYDGLVTGGFARFTAQLTAHVFGDAPVLLSVPLGGVLLRDTQVDGINALPKVEAGERYLFQLHGAGAHGLTLRFDVPLTGAADQEVRFAVPELPISRLAFRAPAGATQLQTLTWRGARQVDANPSGPSLEADLGRVGIVHLRWHEPDATPPVKPQVWEMALWDVAQSAATLRCSYRFRLGAVQTTSLEFEVPPGLEPAAASAISTPAPPDTVSMPTELPRGSPAIDTA